MGNGPTSAKIIFICKFYFNILTSLEKTEQGGSIRTFNAFAILHQNEKLKQKKLIEIIQNAD